MFIVSNYVEILSFIWENMSFALMIQNIIYSITLFKNLTNLGDNDDDFFRNMAKQLNAYTAGTYL